MKSIHTATLMTFFISLMTVGICRAQNGAPYPEFTYNGKRLNKLIVNRVPDYGYEGRDGCVSLGEISLELTDKDSVVVGLAKDISSGRSLAGAAIHLKRKDGAEEVMQADSKGQFFFKKTSSIKYLTVQYISCRTMTIRGLRPGLF